MSDAHNDERVVRSAKGVKAVRRKSRTANGVLLHAISVDVLPGPGWADLSSETHATLSISLGTIGGHTENRIELGRPIAGGRAGMVFTPRATPIWGYSDNVQRVDELRVDIDWARVSEVLQAKVSVPTAPRFFRDERLRQLGRRLAAECWEPDSFSQLYIDGLTLSLCIDFLRLANRSSPPTARLIPSQLRRVADHLLAHLSERVTLEDLASLTRLSQSQFARAFKNSTGLTPHRFQLDARIARAKELLLTTSLPHSQIALETGFVDQSHLCRAFKRIVGTSPAAWRRRSD